MQKGRWEIVASIAYTTEEEERDWLPIMALNQKEVLEGKAGEGRNIALPLEASQNSP